MHLQLLTRAELDYNNIIIYLTSKKNLDSDNPYPCESPLIYLIKKIIVKYLIRIFNHSYQQGVLMDQHFDSLMFCIKTIFWENFES